MTKTTQNDIYTPAEANAFHEGREDALVARIIRDTTPLRKNEATRGEAEAYNEGYMSANPGFAGTAYNLPSAL